MVYCFYVSITKYSNIQNLFGRTGFAIVHADIWFEFVLPRANFASALFSVVAFGFSEMESFTEFFYIC